MKRPLVLLTLALACAGCSRKEEASSPDVAMYVTPPAMRFKEAYAADAAAAPAADAAAPVMQIAPEDSPQMRVAAGPPMLAYSYSYGLSLPGRQVDAVRRRHEQACLAAGHRLCQVLSSSIADRGEGAVRGELSMRAAPQWLKTFRDGLEGDAKDAGGRIETSDVTSEDLSREIVDMDAQLKAKVTLRDRLQALLAGRPGRLSDLLAVERELARVQAEIDSTQSQLAVMRGRVAMSEITLTYGARDVVGSTVRSPIRGALDDFFAIIAVNVAAMINIVAAVVPWAAALGVVLWLLRRRLSNLRRLLPKKTAPAP